MENEDKKKEKADFLATMLESLKSAPADTCESLSMTPTEDDIQQLVLRRVGGLLKGSEITAERTRLLQVLLQYLVTAGRA